MPKLLALEWDSHELRVVEGRSQGAAFVADRAWASPLEHGDSGAEELGRRLAEGLAAQGGAKGAVAVVVVSRRTVEIRPIRLPSTPPEEQPDLVRFQAPREFSAFDDDWRIDFVEVDRSEEGVEVLAAAQAPKKSAQIAEICLPAQIQPARIVLRPLAAAELLEGLGPARRVILAPSAIDANLMIHDGAKVVAVRNVRLPADAAPRAAAIRNELQRTLTLARVRFGEEAEEIVVLGAEDEHSFWLAGWTPPLPLRHIDPLPKGMTPESGRFASLVGALQAESAQRPPSIDLLNPRQRPKPKSGVSRTVALAAVAALVVATAIGVTLSQLRAQDRTIQRLTLELANKNSKLVPEAQKIVDMRNSVAKYFERDANWLDELRHISAKVPQDAESVRLNKWTGRANDRTDTEIQLEGGAVASGTIDVMEASLRDEKRRVSGGGGDYDENKAPRPWRFRDRIELAANKQPEALTRAINLASTNQPTRVVVDARQLHLKESPESTPAASAGPASTGTSSAGSSPTGSSSASSSRAKAEELLRKRREAAAAAAAASKSKQPADDKPADDKSADDNPVDDKPVNDEPVDDKPAGDKPVDDKPADDKPADGKPADDKPADEEPGSGEGEGATSPSQDNSNGETAS